MLIKLRGVLDILNFVAQFFLQKRDQIVRVLLRQRVFCVGQIFLEQFVTFLDGIGAADFFLDTH